MSHIKQTQQTSVLRSQVNSRPQRRVDQSENRPIGHGRAHVQTGVAQTNIRPVSTRTDNMHPLPKGAPPISEVETHSILKRSLSKLRIKDAISPSKHNTVQAQAKRGPLQPASKIPQAPAPSTARIIGARPDQSAFVVHGLTPPRTRHMHQNDTQQNAQQKPHAVSPARDKNNADIRSKAMQLGIFKISETDLKDRFQFLEEIGAGEWGSVWSVEALRPLDHLPGSAYRSLQVVKLTGSGNYTVDNSANFRPLAVKLCKREHKYSAAARTQRLWNEFKVLRTLMDQLPRAEQVNADSPNCRVRNDRTGWHPNVVNFYEFLLTPTLAMLVMPKFDEPMKVCLGDNLCRNYFQQLLSAVHWLHQHGVCHNDIKVDNLGVTYDTTGLGRDTVTLFDFGFANRYDLLEEGAFMSKEVWGTPEYLAPERCRAILHDERKTDIWALGITFFEMLTGRTPFEYHDEKFDTKERFEEYYARAERGKWLGEWDLSPEMEDLIRKMLRHDPAERVDAAGALLHPQFHSQPGRRCDSFDELLQLSYEDEHRLRATEAMISDPEPSPIQEELDDSDAMIEELVARTERLQSQSETASVFASPGVSRAAVATHPSLVPASPSLSQVGMDSRLTDLMCVSPPWRGKQPPRQGTPIPSAHRNRILTQALMADKQDDHEDDDSIIYHSPVKLSTAEPRKLAPLTKQSPFRLRLGERPPAPPRAPLPAEPQMASIPLSAPAALAPKSAAQPLPQLTQEPPKSTLTGARGNVVASLAKKFDASNFLSRPPAHIAAQQTGLGLTFRGRPAAAKHGLGHRRSKSHTLAQPSKTQQGVARHSVRRSTGSIGRGLPHDVEMPECARRLFSEPQPRVELDVDSARSDTKGAGAEEVAATRTPALHAVLAGEGDTSMRTTLIRSPCEASTPIAGEEVIFRKLKKMASLAGMLTRMIDETKSTILTPGRPASTPVRGRSRLGSGSSGADISPGLLKTPVDSEDQGDTSLVSATFSLDLSGRREGSEEQSGEALTTQCSPPAARRQMIASQHTPSLAALSEAGTSVTPSAKQVEGMYSSFLLSQNVSKSGSGFLSPSQPTTSASGGGVGGRAKGRGLAALFGSNSGSLPTFNYLKEASQEGQTAGPATPAQVVCQTPKPTASPTKQQNQLSTGRRGRLARLFRKQA